MATKSQIDKWIKEGTKVWIAGLGGPIQGELIYRDYSTTLVQEIGSNARYGRDHQAICLTEQEALTKSILILKELCNEQFAQLDENMDRLQGLVDRSEVYESIKEFWTKEFNFFLHTYKLMKYKKGKK